MSDVEKMFKQAIMQVGAGGSAGFVEVCVMHPLDLVKTRLQLQSTKPTGSQSPHIYAGVIDCLSKMRRHEGITSFWKGILPPILAETPKRAVKFLTFEQYKRFFMFGSSTPTPLVRFYFKIMVFILLYIFHTLHNIPDPFIITELKLHIYPGMGVSKIQSQIHDLGAKYV